MGNGVKLGLRGHPEGRFCCILAHKPQIASSLSLIAMTALVLLLLMHYCLTYLVEKKSIADTPQGFYTLAC